MSTDRNSGYMAVGQALTDYAKSRQARDDYMFQAGQVRADKALEEERLRGHQQWMNELANQEAGSGYVTSDGVSIKNKDWSKMPETEKANAISKVEFDYKQQARANRDKREEGIFQTDYEIEAKQKAAQGQMDMEKQQATQYYDNLMKGENWSKLSPDQQRAVETLKLVGAAPTSVGQYLGKALMEKPKGVELRSEDLFNASKVLEGDPAYQEASPADKIGMQRALAVIGKTGGTQAYENQAIVGAIKAFATADKDDIPEMRKRLQESNPNLWKVIKLGVDAIQPIKEADAKDRGTSGRNVNPRGMRGGTQDFNELQQAPKSPGPITGSMLDTRYIY